MSFLKYCFFFIFTTVSLWSAIVFPKLTSQVVDEANLFNNNEKSQLIHILSNHEKNSTNQIVIVTLKSLNGYDISEYGYQLGREWGIGQKENNNGVLLIIVPNERKVRIEVGYGLEGALTDATSKLIISNIITPYFKKGEYFTGTKLGVDAIEQTIQGEYSAKPQRKQDNQFLSLLIMPVILLFLIFIPFISRVKSDRTKKLPFVGASVGGIMAGMLSWGMLLIPFIAIIIGIIVFILILFGGFDNYSNRINNGGNFGGFSSGSSSSGFGGFSGGGGSFGGGGASGSW